MCKFFCFVLLIICNNARSERVPSRPNIVFILADDMGWNDVSYHGSNQYYTPNIDTLAHSGIALHRYYTHCKCTPSRAATLTGKYAHRLGLDRMPIYHSEDNGIPVGEKLLPQYLKELGYSTHLVGKWHVGHSRLSFLPTSRGFDTYFGNYGPAIDYYDYTYSEQWPTGTVSGFDMYRNLTPAWDVTGYVTDVYTDEAKKLLKSHDVTKPLFLMLTHTAGHAGNFGAPLQAPPQSVRDMRQVEIAERRIYAAMIKKMDDSVGEMVKTLYDTGMLNNTIIIFASDNGGMTTGYLKNWASNWPLRGLKVSPWEGGMRVPGLIWTPSVNSGVAWQGKMHSTDWLPTLLHAAKGDAPADIDGINQWTSIMTDQPSDRTDIYEIDGLFNYAAVISGKYKLVTGNVTRSYSDFYGDNLRGVIGEPPPYMDAIKNSPTYTALRGLGRAVDLDSVNERSKYQIKCGSKNFNNCYATLDNWCLYNIEDDPCEKEDLSGQLPDITQEMYDKLEEEFRNVVPFLEPRIGNPKSRPSLHNYTWTYWIDDTPDVSCDF